MTSLKITGIIFLLFIGFTLSSCSDTKEVKTGIEYSSTYVCPMHCTDSGSEKPGKCPVCTMNYIKNTETKNH